MAVPMKPAVLDCPPHQDMFLPFEFPVTELEPGWYGLECDIQVDGVSRTVDGGRRFPVQWPRATVRRGPIKVGRRFTVGDVKIDAEQLDCAGDHAILRFSLDPVAAVAITMTADGQPLAELELEVDETGKGSLTTYPVLRAHASLSIEAAVKGHDSVVEEVALP